MAPENDELLPERKLIPLPWCLGSMEQVTPVQRNRNSVGKATSIFKATIDDLFASWPAPSVAGIALAHATQWKAVWRSRRTEV